MLTKRDLLGSAAVAAFTVATAKSNPVFAQSKAEWPTCSRPRISPRKASIYGLPLVMIYAVMQEFSVNRNSGQFKAPFNDIKNMHHVATPAETAA